MNDENIIKEKTVVRASMCNCVDAIVEELSEGSVYSEDILIKNEDYCGCNSGCNIL